MIRPKRSAALGLSQPGLKQGLRVKNFLKLGALVLEPRKAVSKKQTRSYVLTVLTQELFLFSGLDRFFQL